MSRCPKCHRQFEEPGFCPYDGTALSDGAAPASAGDGVVAVSAKDAESAPVALAALAAQDPKAAYDHLIGAVLDGRYYIDRRLGEGGMGVVFLARHIVIEKPVAIKVLKRDVARDSSTVRRFVQEAKAASRIGHPNIVDVTDFGTTPDGMTYSVMEFVEGRTLSQVIRAEAPLPVERALPIIGQIAGALAAAHDKGIVHRDMKPENVFVIDRDGRRDFVKIVDFGIAKVTATEGAEAQKSRLTRQGSVFGTPEYMAPEQAAGRGDIDQRVDVYALGTIFYEMVTGHVPHKSNSMVRTLAMQMLDPIERPTVKNPDLVLSPEVEEVIMTALAKKREERYQDMRELMRALRLVSGGVALTQPLSASSQSETLVPLPPGADGKPTENIPAPPLRQPTARPEGPRKRRRSSKQDPAFVDRTRPPDYDEVLDAEPAPSGRARWPLAIGAVLLLGAGAAAAVAVSRGQDAAVVAVADAGVTPADARTRALITEIAVDAAPLAVAVDAGPTPVVDRRPGDRRPDRRPGDVRPDRRPDAGVAPRGKRTAQVITVPEGGTVYIDGAYRGPSGVTLSGANGSRARASCRLPGFENGAVAITFDDGIYQCRMKRIKKCLEGTKNPFDDCDPGPETTGEP